MSTVTAPAPVSRPADPRPRPELGDQAAAWKTLEEQTAALLGQVRAVLNGDVAVSPLSGLAASLNRNADVLDGLFRNSVISDALLTAAWEAGFEAGRGSAASPAPL